MKVRKILVSLLILSSLLNAGKINKDIEQAAHCSGIYQGLAIHSFTLGEIGESRFKKNMKYANGFYYEFLNVAKQLQDQEAQKHYSRIMGQAVNYIINEKDSARIGNKQNVDEITRCGFMMADIYYAIAKKGDALKVDKLTKKSIKNNVDIMIQRVNSQK